MTKCSTARCKRPATVGYKTCVICRKNKQESDHKYLIAWRLNHPEHYREIQRKNALKRYQRIKNDPKRLAKFRATNLRSNAAWYKKNRDKVRASGKLAYNVKIGKVLRPKACQHCGKAKRPIVAYWVGDEIAGWYCWGCWWKRRRGEF